MHILTPNDWLQFRELFDKQNPKFIIQLKAQYPILTNTEIRLFLLIKAGFEATKIAAVSGVSTNSIYTSRYRLRKKLNLAE